MTTLRSAVGEIPPAGIAEAHDLPQFWISKRNIGQAAIAAFCLSDGFIGEFCVGYFGSLQGAGNLTRVESYVRTALSRYPIELATDNPEFAGLTA